MAMKRPATKNDRKRYTLLLLAVLLFMGACNTPQSGVNRAPSALAWKNGVKGKWVLEAVDRENIPADYSVKTLFEEAPPECFIGSEWNLPSNGKGSITFHTEGVLCAPGAVRNIFWSIYNPGKNEGEPKFQFKKIYPGDHPKHVIAGYRLELAYADEESLRMIMPIPLDGQRYGNLVLTFTKAQ